MNQVFYYKCHYYYIALSFDYAARGVNKAGKSFMKSATVLTRVFIIAVGREREIAHH
jgi:hypothetical protein